MGHQPRWARTIQHQSTNQHQCSTIGLPQGLHFAAATALKPEGEERRGREGRKIEGEIEMQSHHSGGGIAPGTGGNATAASPNGAQAAMQAAARPPAYMQKAMEEIKNSLRPFAKESCMGGSSAASTISSYSATSGLGSSLSSATSNSNDVAQLRHLLNMGYVDVSGCGDRPSGYTKLIRKASVERELPATARGSPALDSGAASTRSDSPRLTDIHSSISSRYSPSFAEPPPPPPPRNTPPPPPPPHCGGGGGSGAPTVVSTGAPPSVVVPSNVQQMFKRMSPAPPPIVPARGGQQPVSVPVGVVSQQQSSASVVYSTQGLQQRGTSPVSSVSSGGGVTMGGGTVGVRPQPMVVANGPAAQQQLTQQMQALRNGGGGGVNGGGGGVSAAGAGQEPPPPYPVGGGVTTTQSGQPTPPPPPSYRDAIQNRQSPTQDFRKSPSSGIYSGSTSAGSPSPVTVSSSCSSSAMARPAPLQAWGARQTVSQPPIIMQSVKSTQVQKPVLQTAVAPAAPQQQAQPQQMTVVNGGAVVAATEGAAVGQQQPPPPSYTASMQQKGYATVVPKPAAPLPAGSSAGGGVVTVPTTEPPSYASTMQAKAAKAQQQRAPPPPPYTPTPASVAVGVGVGDDQSPHLCTIDGHQMPSPRSSPLVHPHPHPPLQRKYSPAVTDTRSDSPQSTSSGEGRLCGLDGNVGVAPPLPPTASSSVKNHHVCCNGNGIGGADNGSGGKNSGGDTPPPQVPPHMKIKHQSPIPERKKISKEKEEERRDCKVKNYSPQAFKFFMEQHIENVIKSYRQRLFRRMQLEKEMNKIGLGPEAQMQMRKMLSQKESNYIRLKRAKMDKSMFVRIKPIGVGAFGEVTLVRKIDTNHLYAMKTLRKADVLKRNQVAHVKAERDILAEADNEWVVKLYYSFQDSDILYFVMDYIPGGDLMSLLIKLGIFEESLARFYIAELACAVESVHKMGFIHRDIKPDNILIDKDGHIKLTDFGLCTGFRWTHNSKYYQPNEHNRQDSMDPIDDWSEECKCVVLKPLERRRRREHRCLAHSLVGTPNYIAPEVLQRTGYTHVCDWWSVGVILYEMLVGQPPFLANTPAETQYKVINWETTLQIPKQANLSKESTDLILKLCCSADKRLGKNANEVKSHPFFREIDFEKGLRRQPAPHKPKIDYPTDTSNFDPIDPDKLRNSPSMDSSTSEELVDNSKLFHGFFEFTFRRFFDDGGLAAFNKINLDDNENQGGPVYV
nr:unnamed protein product [Callosobruchus analis]